MQLKEQVIVCPAANCVRHVTLQTGNVPVVYKDMVLTLTASVLSVHLVHTLGRVQKVVCLVLRGRILESVVQTTVIIAVPLVERATL